MSKSNDSLHSSLSLKLNSKATVTSSPSPPPPPPNSFSNQLNLPRGTPRGHIYITNKMQNWQDPRLLFTTPVGFCPHSRAFGPDPHHEILDALWYRWHFGTVRPFYVYHDGRFVSRRPARGFWARAKRLWSQFLARVNYICPHLLLPPTTRPKRSVDCKYSFHAVISA